MDIDLCYRILQVRESSTNEDISRSFKAMAMKYHPDKNPQEREWANEQMTILNTAYSTLMSFRFNQVSAEAQQEYVRPEDRVTPEGARRQSSGRVKEPPRTESDFKDDREYLIRRFVKAREDAKDSMYRYFQYSLYNFHRREQGGNRKIYNDMIISLRKSYHLIKKFSTRTDDKELLIHFDVFSKLVFDFYRASECLNVIDSYRDSYEVDAYRMYRKGDEFLLKGEKELFYDRHNRGFFDRKKAVPEILDAENLFRRTLQLYKNSSWAVETAIKLEYAVTLKTYISLFFSEE